MVVPEAWVAVVVGALAGAVLCLWRDNLKLRTALIRETEEKVKLCLDILREVKSRRTGDENQEGR